MFAGGRLRMSGIAGIVNLDQAPVDPRLLRRLTDFLAFRGPDAQETWMDRHVGFAHTALWTTFESERERQPSSLDGQVWITADARVDGRADMIPQLESQGRTKLAEATDSELILHAYHAWGESCVEHLIGDFAFAIWDGRERRLFCARDHLGVKPFYYAQVGNCVIFSNTLDCLRQHPAVSDKLNEAAIADFLLSGVNEDPSTTTFANIQRLPPAHTATWSPAGVRIRRYWTLPIDDLVHYPRPQDYADRFLELLRVAVRDRLRTKRLGIFMSGGLDSPGLAVAACDLLRERPGTFSVEACTTVYDRLIPHQERYYAGLVARHLGIPIRFYARGQEILTPWDEQSLSPTPEPVANPFTDTWEVEFRKEVASRSRVFFYGDGPDEALTCDWRAHLATLVQERRWHRLLPDFWYHVVGHPRIPFVGRVRHWRQGYRKPSFPAWLNADFASRLRLRERWEELQSGLPPVHPTRPRGYRAMSTSLYPASFESYDILSSRTSSEVRYPYLDLRIVRFLLSVPAIPWCCDKYLLRRALAGALPRQVARRPKAPLAKDPSYERARRSGMPKFPVDKALSWYTSPDLIPQSVGKNIEDFRANMLPIGLAYWLRSLEIRKQSINSAEAPNETTREQASISEGLPKAPPRSVRGLEDDDAGKQNLGEY
jgi:asparagine synthase (glutamine-hydrolysing)